MVNEFNYLPLRELFLIRIRHFDYLDTVQQFKVMWAIDRVRKLQAKLEKQNLESYFQDENVSVSNKIYSCQLQC